MWVFYKHPSELSVYSQHLTSSQTKMQRHKKEKMQEVSHMSLKFLFCLLSMLIASFSESHLQKFSTKQYKGGIPQMEFIYKKLHIYPYMFKLQSPSKYSPFDTIYLSSCFFHCWKQFLNSLILMPFNASAIFCFTPSTLAKHFPLRIFSSGETNIQKKLLKVILGE